MANATKLNMSWKTSFSVVLYVHNLGYPFVQGLWNRNTNPGNKMKTLHTITAGIY